MKKYEPLLDAKNSAKNITRDIVALITSIGQRTGKHDTRIE